MGSHDRFLPAPFAELGMTYRQLDHWCRRGYLRPIVTGGGGSGRYRKWTPIEVEIGRRMFVLVTGGYRVAAAARFARLSVEETQEEEQTAI